MRNIGKISLSLFVISLAFTCGAGRVQAEEATTFTDTFAVPVFDSIDENGVDLTSGVWRVTSPTISRGDPDSDDYLVRGLRWTGQAWTRIGHPSLWRDGDKYIVNHMGTSHEFNGFGKNFSKRAPIDGSSLSCNTLVGKGGISSCRFTGRNGDKIEFFGFYSSLSNFGSNMGYSSLQFGNVGIQQVFINQASHDAPPGAVATKIYGVRAVSYGQKYADVNYYKRDYYITLGYGNDKSKLRITTPNHYNDDDDHYLRPKGTTQSITDDFGNVWRYTFNSDRELTQVAPPGGLAPMYATYDGDRRVRTILNSGGLWNYSYENSGNFRTTTVRKPDGSSRSVRYIRDDGRVIWAKDELGRLTEYFWNNDTKRIIGVRYPEGNYVNFWYDARGNVTQKREVGKGGSGARYWKAGYAASCGDSNYRNCNKPVYTVDPNGNRTDYQYSGNKHGPDKIISPAPVAGGPRPTRTIEYASGLISKTKTCRTSSTCAGGAGEIIQGYKYSRFSASTSADALTRPPWADLDHVWAYFRPVREETATSGGQVLLTCHQLDSRGRRVATTPPNANLTACPTALVSAGPVNANPPEAGPSRKSPVFASGDSAVDPTFPEIDDCIITGEICP